VIPALIVMVPVLIVMLFGGIGGSTKSVEEYLDEIENGGKNERQQALFGLTRQLLDWASQGEPESAQPDGIDLAEIMPRLELAWARVREDEPEVRFVLAATFALLEQPEGVPRLAEVLSLSDAEDPDGQLRYQALYILGARGDPAAFEAVRPYVRHTDPGLRAFAVIALQRMPLELVRETLVEALGDEDLIVRGNAAIALARLGDPAGASVLVALLDPATYAEERERDRRRFAKADFVAQQRLAVLEALGRLRRPQDLERVRTLARDDPDLNVRSAAKALESEWASPPEERN
jgi:HEAT repeat protein